MEGKKKQITPGCYGYPKFKSKSENGFAIVRGEGESRTEEFYQSVEINANEIYWVGLDRKIEDKEFIDKETGKKKTFTVDNLKMSFYSGKDAARERVTILLPTMGHSTQAFLSQSLFAMLAANDGTLETLRLFSWPYQVKNQKTGDTKDYIGYCLQVLGQDGKWASIPKTLSGSMEQKNEVWHGNFPRVYPEYVKDPKNPKEMVRSFEKDSELVDKMLAAYEGLRQNLIDQKAASDAGRTLSSDPDNKAALEKAKLIEEINAIFFAEKAPKSVVEMFFQNIEKVDTKAKSKGAKAMVKDFRDRLYPLIIGNQVEQSNDDDLPF